MKRPTDREPLQGDNYGRRVMVIFGYDTTKQHKGTIVRDDAETPFVTIIRLDVGQYVLGTECQYRVA